MLSRLLTVAAFTLAAESAVWNYDRCDAAAGPASWAAIGKCGGVQQSPINLCGAVPFPRPPAGRRGGGNANTNYTITQTNQQRAHILTVQNMGHTIQATVNTPIPTIRIPALHILVGRSQAGSVINPTWTFAQTHIHFGREGNPNEGSEHTMDGRRYPAELHLVHYNPARGANLSAALASNAADAVLVVGVFLELGDVESALVTSIAAVAANLKPPPTNTPVNASTRALLSDVVNTTDGFYSYGGSLTTPGCNEQVTWVVMKTPKTITPASLDNFKLAKENANETMSLFGNYRPVNPLGSRVLYYSRNISSPCQVIPVADPCYNCGAAPVLFQAQTGETTTTAECAGTPSWVWIVIGVSVPTALLLAVGIVYYYASGRHSSHTEKVAMAYSPFHTQPCSVPNSAVNEQQW